MKGPMLYLLAIVLPPLAVLLCGKPIEALLNVVLTLCFWVPGALHAIAVVNSHRADQRPDRVIRATTAASESERAILTDQHVVGRDGRVACAQCGYHNSRSRKLCRECRVPIS